MAQELLTTFAEELGGVTLKPSEVSGRYAIMLMMNSCLTGKAPVALPISKKSSRSYAIK
jgi:predicted Rdx family selenoprotein